MSDPRDLMRQWVDVVDLDDPATNGLVVDQTPTAQLTREPSTSGRGFRRPLGLVGSAGPSRADVVTVAAGQIGLTEDPPGSNRVPYWPAVGQPAGNTQGWPWCAGFVTWVLLQVGVDIRKLCSWPYYCPTVVSWAKSSGRWITANPRPGDLVLYSFTADRVAGHIGIHEATASTGLFQAIEGNTSPTNAGSQSNGGGVFRRVRSRGVILGWVSMDGLLSDIPSAPAGGRHRTVVVKPGDTLGKIIAVVTGAGIGLGAWLAVNPQVKNPDVIYPGQTLNVPDVPGAPPAPGPVPAPAPIVPPAPPAPAPRPSPTVIPSPKAPTVSMRSPLRRGASSKAVKAYQVRLRAWLAKRIGWAAVNRLNPHKATGYFGPETTALTLRAYAVLRAAEPGQWGRPGGYPVPGPALLHRLGLR